MRKKPGPKADYHGMGTARIEMRLPDELKAKFMACAKRQKKTLSAWMIQCAQHSADGVA